MEISLKQRPLQLYCIRPFTTKPLFHCQSLFYFLYLYFKNIFSFTSETISAATWLGVCFCFFLPSGFLICFSDNFQDQMKRELSYREEMVQQLHIVRGETHKAEETQTNKFDQLVFSLGHFKSQITILKKLFN